MTTPQTRLSPWLLPISRHSGCTSAMFCFPYAGGGASVYRAWSKLFPAEIELYSIQAPGRETRFSEPFVSSVTELASAVAQAIQSTTDKPIILFGHSLGAACAYETARALQRFDRTPELLIVSGRQCPGTRSKRAPISHLTDAQFLQQVRTYKGTPTAVLENEELMELLLPLLRSDFALAEHYTPTVGSLLRCSVLGLGSMQDEWLDASTLEPWGALTQGDFETHWFEGDHFYLNHRAAELASLLKEKIATRLKDYGLA